MQSGSPVMVVVSIAGELLKANLRILDHLKTINCAK